MCRRQDSILTTYTKRSGKKGKKRKYIFYSFQDIVKPDLLARSRTLAFRSVVKLCEMASVWRKSVLSHCFCKHQWSNFSSLAFSLTWLQYRIIYKKARSEGKCQLYYLGFHVHFWRAWSLITQKLALKPCPLLALLPPKSWCDDVVGITSQLLADGRWKKISL